MNFFNHKVRQNCRKVTSSYIRVDRFLVDFLPLASPGIFPLHIVPSDGRATITAWWVPLDLDKVFVAVLHSRGAWFARFGCMGGTVNRTALALSKLSIKGNTLDRKQRTLMSSAVNEADNLNNLLIF